ncbi:MAG: glycosyltransferase family 2 protein [Limisphaerales bacterium]
MSEARLPVSVCMICASEAHRVRASLDSVAAWAGEIIVVLNDTVSDGTDKIAESFGAKVFREPWKGFVAQKNSAADKCAQPWLLNLDADEVVTPSLQKEIAAVTTDSGAPYAAYQFPRCAFYCGRWIRHGDWYPDHVLRLWRRGSARWAGGQIHEQLQVNGRVGRLRSDLLHYTNENIERHISKIAVYHADFVKRRAASGRPSGFFEFVARPPWRFFRAYILRLGFLDGWQGYYIARFSAFSTLTKYAMLLEACRETPKI